MHDEITALIGEYQEFFTDLLQRLIASGIIIDGLPLVQLLYRTSTGPEYKRIRDALKEHCREYVETDFNGRPIAILILATPLNLGNGFFVDMIELAAPRPSHMYPSGLESIGVFVGDKLPEFKKQYRHVLTGVKDHGKYCKPAFITFDNGKTVKFYDISLKELVLLEGWRFAQLDQEKNSIVNVMAERINAWVRYLYTVQDWHTLVRGITPKEGDCGKVYELENPTDRPHESFAVADMRAIRVAAPHYHNRETEIYIVLEGSGVVVVGGKEIQVEEHSVVVTPPETAHFVISQSLVVAVINTPAFNVKNVVAIEKTNKKVGFDEKQFRKLVKGK